MVVMAELLGHAPSRIVICNDVWDVQEYRNF